MGPTGYGTETLYAKAREAYADNWAWAAIPWHFWIRLEDRRAGSSTLTAHEHLDRLRLELRSKHPGIHFLGGIDEQPYLHAHVALSLSARLRLRYRTPAEVQDWLSLWWPHGGIWVADFDHQRFLTEHRNGGGALRYVAKHPDTMVWG
ncbi:MAG TPA: hypothetical protein VI504_00220 [Candidatus Eisenbacteria bacterium]|jgi:hypothetical protein